MGWFCKHIFSMLLKNVFRLGNSIISPKVAMNDPLNIRLENPFLCSYTMWELVELLQVPILTFKSEIMPSEVAKDESASPMRIFDGCSSFIPIFFVVSFDIILMHKPESQSASLNLIPPVKG